MLHADDPLFGVAEVRAALGSMAWPNIYPDPETRALRAALAADSGVPEANLLVGCGADELIDLLMRCTLDSGDAILDCPPTFTMYAFDAAVNDARVIAVPRRADFSIDVPAVVAAVLAQRPKLLFLTSPNNPDGSLLAEADLVELLKLPVLVVLDEAYIEFSGVPSKVGTVCSRSTGPRLDQFDRGFLKLTEAYIEFSGVPSKVGTACSRSV